MAKFYVGDNVKAHKLVSHGIVNLTVVDIMNDGWYVCRVEDTEKTFPYHERELSYR